MTARTSLAWLAHPATLVALIVLVVNDHVLKAVWPGPVTGKLSDVAGLLVAPPLLAVLVTVCAPRLPQRLAAVGATVAVGAGFTIVKSSGTAAAAASDLWTVVAGPSLVRADLTDLLALPALLGALAVWRQARTRPAPTRLTRAVRVGVVLPLALLGVAATSADQTGTSVGAGVDGSGRLVVSDGDYGRLTSADGGRTFQREPEGRPGPQIEWTVSAERQCLADQRVCYRVVPDRLRVEQSPDGGMTWTVAWEVSEHAHHLLSRGHGGFPFDSSGVRSHGLAAYELPQGGHVVVVANGHDGLAVRDVTGAWTRIGDASGPPEPLPGALLPPTDWLDHILPELVWALLALLACRAVANLIVVRRAGDRRPVFVAGGLIVLSPVLFVAGGALSGAGLPAGGEPDATGILAANLSAGLMLAGLGTAVAALIVALASGAGHHASPRARRLSLLTGIAVYLPYLVWGSGAVTDYRASALASTAVFLIGLTAVVVHTATAALPPSPSPVPDAGPVDGTPSA